MKLKNKVGMAYDICLENRKKFYIHLLAAFIFYSILIFLIYLVVDAVTFAIFGCSYLVVDRRRADRAEQILRFTE